MTTTIERQHAREFGETMALAASGVSRKEGLRIKAAVRHLDARNNPDARIFEQAVIKMAAVIMKEAGRMDTLSYHLADQIIKNATVHWPPEFSEFAGMVMQAVGRESLRQKHADTGELTQRDIKAAAAKWLMGATVGKGVSMTPELIEGLLGLSALTGGAMGGLAWKLNRDTDEDDAKLEGMKARIDTYDRITNDVERNLKDRARSVTV